MLLFTQSIPFTVIGLSVGAFVGAKRRAASAQVRVAPQSKSTRVRANPRCMQYHSSGRSGTISQREGAGRACRRHAHCSACAGELRATAAGCGRWPAATAVSTIGRITRAPRCAAAGRARLLSAPRCGRLLGRRVAQHRHRRQRPACKRN